MMSAKDCKCIYVLIKCQKQFEYYAKCHKEKGNNEKSLTNQKYADMIKKALEG